MKLSIITINLNNKEGLSNTLKSIFENQTFRDFESIVIDGDSLDGSQEVLALYSNRIAYSVSERDSGIYNAMNKGILAAKGEYLLFLNSGDTLAEDILKTIFSHKIEDDIVYGNCLEIDKYGMKVIKKAPAILTFDYFFKASLFHCSTLIKRVLFKDDLYSEEYKIVSDWEFFVRKIILENVSCQYLNIEIGCFDTTGISSNEKYKKLQQQERQYVLKSFFPERVLDDYNGFSIMDNLKGNEIYLNLISNQTSNTFRHILIKVINILSLIYLKLNK